MPPLLCSAQRLDQARLYRTRKPARKRQTILSLERCEDRTLLATVFGVTSAVNLIQFDSNAPAMIVSSNPITNLGAGETIRGIDFRPANGQLYALTTDAGSVGRLYTIDSTTAAATLRSTISVPVTGSSFGVNFNPVPDRLRVVSDTNLNLRIDVTTGVAIVDGTLTYATGDPNFGQDPNVVGSAYTNSFNGATATTLYQIDTNLGILAIQNPPNNGTLITVGSLGLNVTSAGGFDILSTGDKAAPQNQAIAALQVGGSNGLYSVNLTNGTASLLGMIGDGTTQLVGMSLALDTNNLVSAANALSVDASNNLVRFNTQTPGTIVSSTPITGLQPGESILGLDFRPATGQLFALGSTSRLYTINPLNAVATPVGSGPFTPALSGTAFGFDFNPTVDRIRVVSNTGQDLRLNPNDGTVAAVDGTLAYAPGDPNAGQTPNITGSAYLNNIVGATSTTLYGIDTTLGILVIQNPPNNGTLLTVGPLGVAASAVGGFDIRTVGGQNYAYATLVVGGSTNLYQINLTTGAARLIAPVGSMVRGLAIAPEGFSAVLVGSTVTFTGTSANVTLVIDQSGGLLRHNQFDLGAPGYNSPFDFDPTTPGDQTLSATDATVQVIVNSGAGNNRVTLGSASGPLGGLVASFLITGQAGSNILTLDDSAGTVGRLITISDAQVTGFGGNVFFSGLSALRVLAGSGNDTFNVIETPSYGVFAPTLDGGGGFNTLNADARGAATRSTLSNIIFNRSQVDTGTVSFTNIQRVNVVNSAGMPLVPVPPPQTINAVAGTQVVNVIVAQFRDTDSGAVAANYQAIIDWGDATSSPGVVIQDTSDPTLFHVLGSHTYSIPGTYTVNSTIVDLGGTSTISGGDVTVTTTYLAEPPANITATAIVTAVPITPFIVTGRLDPASDSGVSNQDGITNVTTPNFIGTSAPGSVVRVFVGIDPATRVLIASTVADSNGAWRATVVNPLADSAYANLTVEATAVDGVSQATSPLALVIIDTVGPRITSMTFDRLRGSITVTFQDDRSGLNQSRLVDRASYVFTGASVLGSRRNGPFLITSATTNPQGSPTDSQTIELVINNGRLIRGGQFFFTVQSGGIEDLAGNALDGEFFGQFPSGNSQAGGNFVASLVSYHRVVVAPAPVGTGSLNIPGAIGNRAAANRQAVAAARRNVAASHPIGPKLLARLANRPKILAAMKAQASKG
ncbi:DUF4394 domain-containing protein [Singulisphaera acidiphila]|uniref:DUF4394 domain-containing protein n=1 Tax=Singulisphaera acidiphila (strain ATCC BAA-1392 / DSM 18658 / VKM B-2454 / MOB10) TaxID=886293 RepID=L0DQ09_SINAD|nr:DUF4394 domain-containing protein [Singulisphaera acidiphila]AGA30776.1 hypothetical protein Sinac_6706 [Singulisphaera acidiphila DSM 18658]